MYGLVIIGMFVYDLYNDIKQYQIKKYLRKNATNICPRCYHVLTVKKVGQENNGDIDYFSYCDKCDTIYKVKYKEKNNEKV